MNVIATPIPSSKNIPKELCDEPFWNANGHPFILWQSIRRLWRTVVPFPHARERPALSSSTTASSQSRSKHNKRPQSQTLKDKQLSSHRSSKASQHESTAHVQSDKDATRAQPTTLPTQQNPRNAIPSVQQVQTSTTVQTGCQLSQKMGESTPTNELQKSVSFSSSEPECIADYNHLQTSTNGAKSIADNVKVSIQLPASCLSTAMAIPVSCKTSEGPETASNDRTQTAPVPVPAPVPILATATATAPAQTKQGDNGNTYDSMKPKSRSSQSNNTKNNQAHRQPSAHSSVETVPISVRNINHANTKVESGGFSRNILSAGPIDIKQEREPKILETPQTRNECQSPAALSVENVEAVDKSSKYPRGGASVTDSTATVVMPSNPRMNPFVNLRRSPRSLLSMTSPAVPRHSKTVWITSTHAIADTKASIQVQPRRVIAHKLPVPSRSPLLKMAL